MLSQALINELDAIMVTDYGKQLEPKELADLANSLFGFIECLAEIEKRRIN